jgi:prevent-host-death family protein
MKLESIRAVKANLSRIVNELPKEGSVVITKNGRPCAVLMAVTEDTDLETIALSQNKRLWRALDAALARGRKKGFTKLEDL